MASFNYFQGVYCRRIMKIGLAEYFDRFFYSFFMMNLYRNLSYILNKF